MGNPGQHVLDPPQRWHRVAQKNTCFGQNCGIQTLYLFALSVWALNVQIGAKRKEHSSRKNLERPSYIVFRKGQNTKKFVHTDFLGRFSPFCAPNLGKCKSYETFVWCLESVGTLKQTEHFGKFRRGFVCGTRPHLATRTVSLGMVQNGSERNWYRCSFCASNKCDFVTKIKIHLRTLGSETPSQKIYGEYFVLKLWWKFWVFFRRSGSTPT